MKAAIPINPPVAAQIAAYTKVIELVKARVIDPTEQSNKCVYDNTRAAGKPNYCAVGGLLTDAQRTDLKRRRLNTNAPVSTLVKKLGENNIVAATGLPILAAQRLQNVHDNLTYHDPSEARAKLVRHCRNEIRKLAS